MKYVGTVAGSRIVLTSWTYCGLMSLLTNWTLVGGWRRDPCLTAGGPFSIVALAYCNRLGYLLYEPEISLEIRTSNRALPQQINSPRLIISIP